MKLNSAKVAVANALLSAAPSGWRRGARAGAGCLTTWGGRWEEHERR
jgi:hypothetical protein